MIIRAFTSSHVCWVLVLSIRSLALEEVCLLFYQLLVENEAFRVYVLSRTDPDTLVMSHSL